MSESLSHRVSVLLTSLNSKVKSSRIKSFNDLSKIEVFPSIISNPDDYLKNVITPVLTHLEDDSDAIREKSIECSSVLIKQLGCHSLLPLYSLVLPMVFKRIKKEEVEEILNSLVSLLHYMINLCDSTSIPSSFDQYCSQSAESLSIMFKSKDPNMVILSCSVLESLSQHSSSESLRMCAPAIIPSVFKNLSHRRFEIRKRVLEALGEFYKYSSSMNSMEKYNTIQQALSLDEKSSVRVSHLKFCENVLIHHSQKKSLYFPFIVPLLGALYPMIPNISINHGDLVIPNEVSEEAVLSLHSLNSIGENSETDFSSIQINEYSVHPGVIQVVYDSFHKLLEFLIPMLNDWQVATCKYAYNILISIVYLLGDRVSRFAPQLYQRIGLSIKEVPEVLDLSLKAAAYISKFTACSDILSILNPKFSNETPKEVLLILATALNNSSFTMFDFSYSLDIFSNYKLYDNNDLIEPIVHSVLSMISRSPEFRESFVSQILMIILRLCDKVDVIKIFDRAFGRDIASVLSENLRTILTIGDKSPSFLGCLLLSIPKDSILESAAYINHTLLDSLNSDIVSKTAIYRLIYEMCNRESMVCIEDDLLILLLDDMIWKSGKDSIPLRESATTALGSLIRIGAISVEMLDSCFEKVLPMILTSLDDSYSDIVRTSGVITAREFLHKSNRINEKFDTVFRVLKTRLEDPVLPIRIGSIDLIGLLLAKCKENDLICSQFKELFMYLDDEHIEQRDAMKRMIMKLYSTNFWNDIIKESLVIASKEFYHPESKTASQYILNEM